MAKLVNRLTDSKARKLGAGLHPDGDGLYLQVRGTTARCWLYRYMIQGKAREMGLGAFPATSLDTAREERDRYKRLRQGGLDPIAERDRERAAVRLRDAKAMTFGEACASFIRDKSHGWKNEKHRQQWTNTLVTYVTPTLGSMSVQDIDTTAVKKVLDPIWTTKSETASRVRGRIEAVLDWCKALGYREGDNPARWRGNLKDILPATADFAEVVHHPALPYADIPMFMERLRAQQSTSARALEWIILTAVRVNAGLGAVRAEIDHVEKFWLVPKERMKGRRGKAKAHRVPIPGRALEIINEVTHVPENTHLFPGLKKGKPITDGAVRTLLVRMGVENATTHGFRATFKTWAQETTSFSWEVIEKALGHVVGDETQRAYDRGDLFEKRRRLMEAWSAYCSSASGVQSTNVVHIQNAG